MIFLDFCEIVGLDLIPVLDRGPFIRTLKRLSKFRSLYNTSCDNEIRKQLSKLIDTIQKIKIIWDAYRPKFNLNLLYSLKVQLWIDES